MSLLSAILFAIYLSVSTGNAVAQETEWRETLQFGIDAQVAELLETLTRDRV